jgi:hypothetical protein
MKQNLDLLDLNLADKVERGGRRVELRRALFEFASPTLKPTRSKTEKQGSSKG